MKTNKWGGQNWERVTRSEVERMARFPSVAATNVLTAAKDYKHPVFYSLHIGAFVVTERADATAIFGKISPAHQARLSVAARAVWAARRRKHQEMLRDAREHQRKLALESEQAGREQL